MAPKRKATTVDPVVNVTDLNSGAAPAPSAAHQAASSVFVAATVSGEDPFDITGRGRAVEAPAHAEMQVSDEPETAELESEDAVEHEAEAEYESDDEPAPDVDVDDGVLVEDVETESADVDPLISELADLSAPDDQIFNSDAEAADPYTGASDDTSFEYEA